MCYFKSCPLLGSSGLNSMCLFSLPYFKGMDTCLNQNTEFIYVLHYILLISIMPTIRIKHSDVFFYIKIEKCVYVSQPFFSLDFSVAEESYSVERSSSKEQV